MRRPAGRAAVPSPAAYRLRDPALARLRAEDVDPRLAEALASSPLSSPELRRLATAVGQDLWTVPLLRPETCTRLAAELAAIEAWCLAHRVEPERPNSMNRYGLVLADFGLGAFAADLRTQLLAPLGAALFADCGGDRLDGEHAFVVAYDMDADRELSFHVDDSEVTLNLCLPGASGERRFEGGDLWFEGRRCMDHLDSPTRPGERVEVPHQPGVALLHAGKHRHGARPITAGGRRNLILWCRSEAWRQEARALRDAGACPPWCGA